MDCRNDFDCASGQACLTPIGQCVAGTGARLDGGVRDLRAPPADVDLATPVDEDMARLPPGAYGDVCHLDTDCATNICSRNPFATADHECTGDCNAGCRVGDFCAGGLTCAQSDIGKSCNLAGGGQDCRGGACLGGGNAAPFCTRVCQSAVECPAGYSCSSVQGGARVCLNVDVTPPCANDADCWYGTLCDNAGGHQRCLANCRAATDADCPLWHKCTNSNKGWLCVPNLAAGGGGIGASVSPATTVAREPAPAAPASARAA